ncbi:MAG: hypothetical protein ACYSWT_04455 [Planctomycetota bacterium]|jgi:hypothetical protein
MNLRRLMCIALVTSLLIPVTIAMGQDETTEPAPAPDLLAVNLEPPVMPQFRVRLGAFHLFEADVDDGGEFEVSSLGIRVDSRWRVAEGAAVDFTFGYTWDTYDFSGSGSLTGLDPWDDVHTLGFRAVLNWRLDDKYWLFGGPVVSMSAEDGADYSNAVIAGAQAGVRWRQSEDFNIGIGITAISQVDDDPWILPLVFFNWDFQENWTLRSGSFDIGSEGGAGLELAWLFAPRWEASLGLIYERRRFRLDDSSVAPEGVGQLDSFGLYGKIAWVFNEQARVWFTVGTSVYGNLRLENDDGKKIADEDFDPAPFLGLRAEFRF